MKTKIAVAALSLTAPALALANEPVSIRVETADLNLLTPAGQQRLETRIRTDIRRACDVGLRGLSAVNKETVCRRAMHEAAKREVAFAISQAKYRQLARNPVEVSQPGA